MLFFLYILVFLLAADEDFPWASTPPSLQSQSPSSHKVLDEDSSHKVLDEDDPYWSAILDQFVLDMNGFTDWPKHTHLCPPSYFDDLFTKKAKAGLENEVKGTEAAALDIKNDQAQAAYLFSCL